MNEVKRKKRGFDGAVNEVKRKKRRFDGGNLLKGNFMSELSSLRTWNAPEVLLRGRAKQRRVPPPSTKITLDAAAAAA